MENSQEESNKSENVNDAAKVSEEKPATDAENKSQDAEEKPQDAEPQEEPSAELLQKIKNQVEFYFGDVNMQRDKFLIDQTKLDEGWVPMTVMLNFKMLASMSKDVNVILKALESSELMEISEDKKKIRRSPKCPLPEYNEEYRKMQEAKTVYMKGFPLTGTTIEKLKTFMAPYEPFDNIIMRKYQDKEKRLQFKGSVFVQFKTLDDAKAFMARESVKYEDTELIRMWSADYYVAKTKEKEERRQKKTENKNKKNADAEKEEEEACEAEDEENEKSTDLPKGTVIRLSGVPEDCTIQDLKDHFEELKACVAFIDYAKGQTEGWVRLQEENTAKSVVEKMKDGKTMVNNKEVTCSVVEGEEEEEYLKQAKEKIKNIRQKYRTKSKQRKRGHSGQRGKKRRGNTVNDAVPAKKAAVE